MSHLSSSKCLRINVRNGTLKAMGDLVAHLPVLYIPIILQNGIRNNKNECDTI
jgi:hypothetical protein